MNAPQDFRAMTAATVGKDLLQALVLELKLLPDVWVKLSEKKQNDVIDRLRDRVESQIKMAVHVLASSGRTVVAGDLDQVTIKDGVKAVIKFSAAAPSLHELYDAQGKAVLVVVAGAADHTAGMDEVRGESDQRAMDLGKEYTSEDGDGMNGPTGDGVVDGNGLQIDHQPLQEELDTAEEAGYTAASEGKPQSDCPVMAGALSIAWVKGWKQWHEEQQGGTAE
ncbi:cell division protein FtsK [Paraburkholderia sp. D15]|uniref:ribosome modulation factor n=1 Tax=Paraburkholderia sp. D15 TaxID=2880218 RepID=UPI002478AC3A|nr:Rmf/CrpP family protein [Paraburkholderia sp. D15]WGS53532.1 cell division protein FtsK [Paraburkholderia sp. D15]